MTRCLAMPLPTSLEDPGRAYTNIRLAIRQWPRAHQRLFLQKNLSIFNHDQNDVFFQCLLNIFKSDFKIDSASCQIEMLMTQVDFCNLSKSRLDVANRTLAKESILKSNSIKKSTYLIFAMNFSPTDRPLRIRRRSSQDWRLSVDQLWAQ